MKNSIQNIVKTALLFSLFLTLFATQAQAPQAFSYQAVIRNASNALVVNTTVGMRISILQGTATGNASYVETHNATTNSNGLVTIQIGNGTLAAGSFTNINWESAFYFVKTETDITGGTNYTITGTSQLLSVPYAFNSADNKWTPVGGSITNTNSGNVGIGIGGPNYKLHVGNSANAMRIEGPTSLGGKALSIGGFGKIEVDAPGNPGGRFNIQDNGNVAIGSSFPATTKLEVNGFTKLGSDAPAIKVKKLTGTTASAEGSFALVGHGLNLSKILSVSVLVNSNDTEYFPDSYTLNAGFMFNYYVDAERILILNSVTNSENILSKALKIVIIYEE